MEQMQKIGISAEADRELEAMVTEVNNGFSSGRVGKSQLASWIIRHFRQSFEKCIGKIRDDHFDEMAHMRSILKNMAEAKKQRRPFDAELMLAPVRERARGARRQKEVLAGSDEEGRS